MPRHRPAPAVTSGAEMMKTVKAAWDKAPAGPKKDAALKQAQATERAPPLPGAARSLALAELEAYPSGDICGIGVDLVRRLYGGRNGLEPR